jgi:16S rRNA (guanine966-N2)-methyltransferase
MIRITGGEFKGRTLATPPQQSTRPTQAKLRQALFNSIQFQIPDARVLDLFAGSGSLAFEALSRGAANAVLVEHHRGALEAIQRNTKELKVGPRTRVISEDVGKALAQAARLGPFDLVFADPPYAENWEMRLIDDAPWVQLLSEEGVFILEWGSQKSKIEAVPDTTKHLVKIREKVYGDSVLTSYRRKTAEEKTTADAALAETLAETGDSI